MNTHTYSPAYHWNPSTPSKYIRYVYQHFDVSPPAPASPAQDQIAYTLCYPVRAG